MTLLYDGNWLACFFYWYGIVSLPVVGSYIAFKIGMRHGKKYFS